MKLILSKISILILLAISTAISVSAQTPAQDAFAAGLACAEADLDCRITNFTRVIELNATVAEAYFNRGFAYRLKGEHDLAIADFTKAIELKPSFDRVYFVRSNIYLRKGVLDLALADINRYLELMPNDAGAIVVRAYTYGRMGNDDLAIKDLETAIKLYGNSPEASQAYFQRGKIRCNQGCTDLSLIDYNKAIQLDPTFAEPYVERGSIHDSKGQFDLAMADYNKALQLKPNLPRAHNGRGWIYHQQRLFEQAIAEYTTAIRIDPKYATAYCNRGFAYEEIGEYDLAIADDTKALELDPDLNNEIYRSRALAYFHKSKYQDAHNDTVIYLKRNGLKGSAAPYGIMIGYLSLRRNGDADRAATFIKSWLKLLKPNEWSTQILRYFAGEISSDELLALANDNDKQTEAHAYIGQILLADDRRPEALERFMWVKSNGNKTFVEYRLSVRELGR